MSASDVRDAAALTRPLHTPDELHRWIHEHLELTLPTQPVCPHHSAPFEYIRRAYFEPAQDLVVWASRGGGKTRLAAVATLLDLLHKPGCSVRILGGSLEQSLKIWEHLLPDLELLPDEEFDGALRSSCRRVRLANKSSAAVLTQSQRAVRGLRVQKLRCDEVELFTPEIWQAAQLTTRSLSDPPVSGVIEAISTFHQPGGLMGTIIDRATENHTPVLHWCLLDVLEKCPQERDCPTCPLLNDCHGIAKDHCNGFYLIEDAIRQKHRVSLEMWESEMLCKRPRLSDSVFPNFDPEVHVFEPLGSSSAEQISLAVDFGFHDPFVCLWVVDDGVECHVIDEYVQQGRIIPDHIEQIRGRPFGNVKRLCCDPAGNGRSDQTATSNVRLLKAAGFNVLSARSAIIDGLEMIRAALRPAAGHPRLFISPKCTRLIAAFKGLQYPSGGGELPKKDGKHDHLIDALRYFYVNRGLGRIDRPIAY